MPDRKNISSLIARFVVDTNTESIPASAINIARLSVVDWVAVALAGKTEPVSQILRDHEAEAGGANESLVIGHNQRLPARSAALVNGTIGHALDYDDTHFASLGHPSAAVLPAALAIADKIDAQPEQLQTAALLGMELTVRIGQWLGRAHYRKGFHITATAGTFGAAMACARLLGLSVDQIQNALSIAASSAGGVKAQFGTMGKPLHAGLAAANGVQAALLARRGFLAADRGLDGVQGFAESHHGDFNDSAFDGLGETYRFEEVSHKFHACCHGTHAALDALIQLRDRHSIIPENIKTIFITVHPQYLDICNITEPDTALAAKFSYRHVAALASYGYDTTRLDTFTSAGCKDPELTAMRDRVNVSISETMAETVAAVRVTLSNNTTLAGQSDLLSPVDYKSRENRVRAKVASLLGDDLAESLWVATTATTQLPTRWMASI